MQSTSWTGFINVRKMYRDLFNRVCAIIGLASVGRDVDDENRPEYGLGKVQYKGNGAYIAVNVVTVYLTINNHYRILSQSYHCHWID